MRFTDREKRILTTLIKLKDDCNRLKLPTIAAYMQDYYFKKNSDIFLMIFKGRSILFIKHGVSVESRNDCFYQFMEIVFLFKRLLGQELISIFPCFEQKLVYSMSPYFGVPIEDSNHPFKIFFSQSSNYITIDYDKNSVSICDSQGNVLYDAVEITGEINSFICTVFVSGIFVNETLVDFVNNDFMFHDEQISRKNLMVAWCGVLVALLIGVISIIINILSLFCK